MWTRRSEAQDVLCFIGAGLDELADRAFAELLRIVSGASPLGEAQVDVADGDRMARLCVLAVPEGVRHVALLLDKPVVLPDGSGLTRREREVFLLAHCRGLSNAEIASRLDIAVSTVRQHLRHANHKLKTQPRPRSRPRCRGMGRDHLSWLTKREATLARRVARGETNVEIGRALKLSPVTVGTCLTRIYRKLRVRNRSELAAKLSTSRQTVVVE
ncbi:MAG: helix-turn-helix transcriptional regulator [Planctomycetes bacterium]|nr:helix-turn-helix transcriptional regulator [Planctomycetota bacterium]MCW8138467.1 hypothetical protein [Planctomycetota bacterium]